MPLTDFIRVLELAVGPAILVSGIGLLLLSMTNRFGRVIDRARILMPRLVDGRHDAATNGDRHTDGGLARHADDGSSRDQSQGVTAQLHILSRRARALRTAITCAVASLLASVLLVVGLFIAAACGGEGRGVGSGLAACFVASMAALIAALLLFLYELNLSLLALWLELPPDCHGRRFSSPRPGRGGPSPVSTV